MHMQGPQPGSLPFPPNTQRLVRVDTGAERGAPGSGPVLLLPPEFLVRFQPLNRLHSLHSHRSMAAEKLQIISQQETRTAGNVMPSS